MNKITSLLINTSRFFGDFTPIVPYMALFFIQHNITVSQISFLFLLWAFSILVLEIPTGMLADKINRKTILILSRLIKLFCFVVWLAWPNFIGFAIGFILWGLATALDSGAFQAFLYDHLHTYKSHDLFSKYYGNASSWSFIGLLCSALISAFLIHLQWSYNSLLIISILSMTVSGTLFIFAPSPKKKTIHQKEESIFSNTQNNIKLIWSNSLLFSFFVIGITAGGIKGALEEYYPLLLSNGGIALSLVGVSIAGFEFMKSLGSFLAGRIQKNHLSQLMLLILISILLLGIGLSHGWILIAIIAILTLIDAMLWILNDTAIQDISNHQNRATIASYKNFGTELVALIAFFFFTFTSKTQSVQIIYILGGIGMIGMSILITISNRIRKTV